MSLDAVTSIILGIALVGFLMYRQLRWTAVNPGTLWRMPVILTVAGIIVIKGQTSAAITGADVGFLILEAVLALAVGATMGLVSKFRMEGDTVLTRAGWIGASLWIVFIAIRVGIDILAGHSGAAVAASTGVILVMIALNRAGRALVVLRRAPRPAARPAFSR